MKIVEISFNGGVKQYKYLLKDETSVNLKTGKQYRMIKGSYCGQLTYDTVTVKALYDVNVLPNIVTKYLDFKDKQVVSSYIPAELKRDLGYSRRQELTVTAPPTPVFSTATPKPIENTSAKPKIPAYYWYFWKTNVEEFFAEKSVFMEYGRAGSAFFLLKRSNWLLNTIQDFDCSEFLAQDPKINLEDVKQYQKIAQEFLNK